MVKRMDYVTVPKAEYEQLLLYRQIITYVEEELHERQYRKEFVEKIERISEEVKKGKTTSFKNKDEMNAYLDKL